MPAPADDTARHAALPQRFAVGTRDAADGAVVVRPQGELDLATVGVLGQHLEQARATGKPLVLDLAGLTFLDSTGIRLLLQWARLAQDDGFALRMLPGGRAVQEVLELTGVQDALPLEPPA